MAEVYSRRVRMLVLAAAGIQQPPPVVVVVVVVEVMAMVAVDILSPMEVVVEVAGVWHGFSHSEHIVHGTSNWSFATTVEVAKDGVGTSRIMVDSVNNSGKLAMFVGVVKIVLFPAERYVEGIKELYMRERNIVREKYMRGFWL